MAQQFQSAVGPTFSSVARTTTPDHTPVDETDVNQSALEREIRLAACTDVPVLVTGDTLAEAKRVAYAIQERLEVQQIPVAVVNCGVAATRLVELLKTRTGSIVLEDVGTLGNQTQAVLLEFLENRLDSGSRNRRHVRIISTGLTDLYSRVEARTFHEVLFYRLNTIHISLSRQAIIESY
jgi:DNA-binding NtrC family response regulator